MKTKRAYYDCPILALLATKHGIRMRHEEEPRMPPIDFIKIDLLREQIVSMMDSHLGFRGKMIIHPENMHLLEPRDDDWGNDGIFSGRVIGVGENIVTIRVPERHNGKEHYCTGKEDFQIDKRNNMPFPWPKFEEVSQ